MTTTFERIESRAEMLARLPQLAQHHIDYQAKRRSLIDGATAHAKTWEQRSAIAVMGCGRLRETEQRGKMEALAFSNEMQRRSFARGLIGYDPTKCDHYLAEETLLAQQHQIPRAAREAIAQL